MTNLVWLVGAGSTIGAILVGVVLYRQRIARQQQAARRARRAAKKEEEKRLAREREETNKGKVIVTPHAQPSRIKRGRKSVILLVEDSHTVMITLRKVLERWNYQVISAENGREAWAKLQQGQQSRPDLVISDIDMPELNGIELLKLMKEDLTLLDIPVILITGNPFYHLQASQQAGVAGLLTKPFEDKALVDQVRYVLQE